MINTFLSVRLHNLWVKLFQPKKHIINLYYIPWSPKPICLEVFMVNNLVFRRPKILYFSWFWGPKVHTLPDVCGTFPFVWVDSTPGTLQLLEPFGSTRLTTRRLRMKNCRLARNMCSNCFHGFQVRFFFELSEILLGKVVPKKTGY